MRLKLYSFKLRVPDSQAIVDMFKKKSHHFASHIFGLLMGVWYFAYPLSVVCWLYNLFRAPIVVTRVSNIN